MLVSLFPMVYMRKWIPEGGKKAIKVKIHSPEEFSNPYRGWVEGKTLCKQTHA